MVHALFTALDYKRNEHGVCPGGVYQFTFDGQPYYSDHLANGPHGLASSFTLDIERAESNFLAHRGADVTFFTGVTLANGRFARSQAFAARIALDLSGEVPVAELEGDPINVLPDLPDIPELEE